MSQPACRKWRILLEFSCIVIIALASWQGGKHYLRGWHGPAGSLTNDLFIPAIMMNAGEGFCNVDPNSIPGMRAFLDFQSDSFEVHQVPSEVETTVLHPYQEFHRYLIYTVAATWRLWGITWDSIKLLLLAYLFLSCLAIYGICRLGMNPLLALAAALVFIFTPAVYTTLPILRDFAKAPFILGVVFILGHLVFKKNPPYRFLLYTFAAGLLLGIGMGIRRDMMVFLPVGIALIYAGKIKGPNYRFFFRLAASVLLLLTFVLAGWPIHKSLMRSGYLAAHDTIMGFSSYSDSETGLLSPASYEKHYLLNDMYSTIKAHYAAGMGATFPKHIYQERAAEPAFDQEVKDAYVRKISFTFPADMISRTYAAILRATVGISPTPLGIESFGFWFALMALLIIAAQSPFRAWIALGILCYFCGYTSLQYAPRHAFHLCFVPFFFLGFLIQQGLNYFRDNRLLGVDADTQIVPWHKRLQKPLLRAFVWFVITLVSLGLPLSAAKTFQRQNVTALRDSYASAPLEPLPHIIMAWGNYSIAVPTFPIGAEGFNGKCLLEDFRSGIVVATFQNVKMPLNIRAVYEWSGGIGDFGGSLNVAISGQEPLPAKIFFPVHEKTSYTSDWSRFIGLAFPSKQLAFFEGLYKVKTLENITLMPNLAIPENPSKFIFNQQLHFPWQGAKTKTTPYPPDLDLQPKITQIQENIRNRELDTAFTLTKSEMNKHPGSILFPLLLAEILELQGHEEESYAVCVEVLKSFPNLSVVYALVDDFFFRHGGNSRRHVMWASILQEMPDAVLAHKYAADVGQTAETTLSETAGIENQNQ